jgi:hypothetical protein
MKIKKEKVKGKKYKLKAKKGVCHAGLDPASRRFICIFCIPTFLSFLTFCVIGEICGSLTGSAAAL